MAEEKKKNEMEENKDLEKLKYEIAQEIGLEIREESGSSDQTE